MPDGSIREVTIDDWIGRLEKMPGNISKASATKVLSIVSDVRNHPSPGFTDIKCNLRGNDELGHLAGDALLRDVATALASNFRDNDVLGRYGGDEFVAFVPVSGDFA